VQPRTQAVPAAHPGERPARALIAARLSKLQRGGQQGIGIDTQDEKHGAGTYTYCRCTGTGSRRKGCGNMVRMEVVDAAVDEIMATTFPSG
jgi:hypothetical protein